MIATDRHSFIADLDNFKPLCLTYPGFLGGMTWFLGLAASTDVERKGFETDRR